MKRETIFFLSSLLLPLSIASAMDTTIIYDLAKPKFEAMQFASSSPIGIDRPITAPRPSDCHRTPDTETAIGTCNLAAVQFAMRRVVTPSLINSIAQRSKAAFVRLLPEGASPTRDYLRQRIDIHIDRHNRIIALHCG